MGRDMLEVMLNSLAYGLPSRADFQGEINFVLLTSVQCSDPLSAICNMSKTTAQPAISVKDLFLRTSEDF